VGILAEFGLYSGANAGRDGIGGGDWASRESVMGVGAWVGIPVWGGGCSFGVELRWEGRL
jgi:hypothetical protein